MELNADFDQTVFVHAAELPWVASPMAGVSRRMLDRLGDEVARATSIVRFDKGSQFSPHVHAGGEEFIVLKGVFQDEHGDFPVGTYVRNPINTAHTPASSPGCEIFVKLWQFGEHEKDTLRVDTNRLEIDQEIATGARAALLYSDHIETVTVQEWDSGVPIHIQHPGGVELLVLSGGFDYDGEIFVEHSWLRLPKGKAAIVNATTAGARVWVKTGHLNVITIPA